MIQNPILKVLSTFKKYNVKSLLIGGQACIVYGAIEFSRDSDLFVLCSYENIRRLKRALDDLKAELIYVPPLAVRYLKKGHACHFRCKARDIQGLRIDVISKMRGCDSFDKLWKRKFTVTLKDGTLLDVIGLTDLVQSKKTQRDKDWFMLKRLVENDIILNRDNPSEAKIKWWLLESRNLDSLFRLAKKYPEIAKKCVTKRHLLSQAIKQDAKKLSEQLIEEELLERQKDRDYWKPLRKELEILRHKQGRNHVTI